MEKINGYSLKSELTTQNAGFCRWGFCEKGDHEYFIKEFLSPVYPEYNPELSEKTRERKRGLCETFFREKKELYDAISGCRSGNIVSVSHFFRSGSRYYAVTDKITATALSMSEIAGLDESVKMSVICSLLYSISLLHSAGIIHADIKPDNILFKRTRGGYLAAKLIDFDAGFMKEKIPSEIQGDFVYLSPEVYLRMNDEDVGISEKIDIFALGILFHQIWTGELPGIGEEYRYTFEAVLDGAEVVLSSALPEKLAGLIRQMLAEAPEERPGAGDLFELLAPKTDEPVSESVISGADSTEGCEADITDIGTTDTDVIEIEKAEPVRKDVFYVPHDLD